MVDDQYGLVTALRRRFPDLEFKERQLVPLGSALASATTYTSQNGFQEGALAWSVCAVLVTVLQPNAGILCRIESCPVMPRVGNGTDNAAVHARCINSCGLKEDDELDHVMADGQVSATVLEVYETDSLPPPCLVVTQPRISAKLRCLSVSGDCAVAQDVCSKGIGALSARGVTGIARSLALTQSPPGGSKPLCDL